jgi:hypothetical protein
MTTRGLKLRGNRMDGRQNAPSGARVVIVFSRWLDKLLSGKTNA